MLTEPGNETEFTITMTTMEPSSRTFSSTLKLRYGVVENQAPTMQPIPQIESNEDESAYSILGQKMKMIPILSPISKLRSANLSGWTWIAAWNLLSRTVS